MAALVGPRPGSASSSGAGIGAGLRREIGSAIVARKAATRSMSTGELVPRRRRTIGDASSVTALLTTTGRIERPVSRGSLLMTRSPSGSTGTRSSPTQRSSLLRGDYADTMHFLDRKSPMAQNKIEPLPLHVTKSVDESFRAPALARKHNLGLYEVKRIIDGLKEAKKNENGGLDKQSFVNFMRRMFYVTDKEKLDEGLVDMAYKTTNMAQLADPEQFISWYVQNMFTAVANMAGDSAMVASDCLVSKLAKAFEVSPCTIDKVKREFDRYDTDRSGLIEYGEFVCMLETIMHSRTKSDMCADRLERMWKEIDADGSGEVDFTEFTTWFLKYFNPEGTTQRQIYGPVEAFYDSFNPILAYQQNQDRSAASQEEDGGKMLRRRHSIE